jgi:REP element-mobilizing transposase RayT
MGHTLIQQIVRQFSKKFFVKVEQISIQGDHCHLLIRAPRRAKFHAFFRVTAGQIAQRFQHEGLLKPNVTDTPPDLRTGTSLGKHTDLRDGAKTHQRSGRNEGGDFSKGARVQRREGHSKSADLRKSRQPKGTALWKYRPFSRVVRGWRPYKIVRDYIRLNELEAQGRIPYRAHRLKGMSSSDWEILWA